MTVPRERAEFEKWRLGHFPGSSAANDAALWMCWQAAVQGTRERIAQGIRKIEAPDGENREPALEVSTNWLNGLADSVEKGEME